MVAEVLDAAYTNLQRGKLGLGPELPQLGLVGANVEGQATQGRPVRRPVGDHPSHHGLRVVRLPQVLGINIDCGAWGVCVVGAVRMDGHVRVGDQDRKRFAS